MSATLKTIADLNNAGLLRVDATPLDAVAARYAVAITPEMVRLIDRSDPADPIALQFAPDARELDVRPEELTDPIGDARHSPVPGVVHRYGDRVLLKVISSCPVYCRFCFRREMVGPGHDAPLTGEMLTRALDYIAGDKRIWEVILTGGDPFMLSARRAGELTSALSSIGHVKVIRWHTRVPVVDPARVTPEFVAALKSSRAIYVGIHANHAREFTDEAHAAIARLADAGIALVSQSVLLKGVNDNIDALEALMRAFVENRIKPYYLHHGDLAPGTAHFRTTIAEGQALMRTLHARASGLALPTYVIDIPGGVSKAPIGPLFHRAAQGRDEVLGTDGEWREVI